MGEAIIIGDDITITILEVRGNRVRLGITAPKEISVHRLELWREIKQRLEQEQRLELEQEKEQEQKGN